MYSCKSKPRTATSRSWSRACACACLTMCLCLTCGERIFFANNCSFRDSKLTYLLESCFSKTARPWCWSACRQLSSQLRFMNNSIGGGGNIPSTSYINPESSHPLTLSPLATRKHCVLSSSRRKSIRWNWARQRQRYNNSLAHPAQAENQAQAESQTQTENQAQVQSQN